MKRNKLKPRTRWQVEIGTNWYLTEKPRILRFNSRKSAENRFLYMRFKYPHMCLYLFKIEYKKYATVHGWYPHRTVLDHQPPN